MSFLLQNQSFHGYHSNSQGDTLRVLYQKLSYFLMSGEHSNKEIMEEIERQISNLQQKVPCFLTTKIDPWAFIIR